MSTNMSNIHGITFEQSLMSALRHQMNETSAGGGKVTKVVTINNQFNENDTHVIIMSSNHPNRMYKLTWNKKLDKKTFLHVLNKHNKLIERSIKKMSKNNSL